MQGSFFFRFIADKGGDVVKKVVVLGGAYHKNGDGIQKPLKHNKMYVLPYLGVYKDMLSSYISIPKKTYSGINRQIFNFGKSGYGGGCLRLCDT